MESRAECTHYDADDDRSSCNAEFDRHCHTRELQRYAAEDNAEDDAYLFRQQIRCVESLLLIAENSLHVVHRASFSHNCEFVAELEAKIA